MAVPNSHFVDFGANSTSGLPSGLAPESLASISLLLASSTLRCMSWRSSSTPQNPAQMSLRCLSFLSPSLDSWTLHAVVMS